MEMLDYPSWRWGLSLIALTLAFHAAFCCDDGYRGSEVTAPTGNSRICFVAPDPDHDLYGRRDWTAIGCGARKCLLLGVKPTSGGGASMSANDPKRTLLRTD